MGKRKYQHLIRGIPCNSVTRGMVREINKLMAKSESRFRIRPRGRGPRPPYAASVPLGEATTMSLYLEGESLEREWRNAAYTRAWKAESELRELKQSLGLLAGG